MNAGPAVRARVRNSRPEHGGNNMNGLYCIPPILLETMKQMEHRPTQSKSGSPEFVAGGGEMGERIRAFDWAKTPLGPLETWPQSLRTCIRIMLTSRQPIWIGWGPQLIKLYNDPYKAIAGGKHPRALGRPA